MMLQTIHFHGSLAKKYSKAPIKIVGDTVQHVFQGLCSRFGNGFKNQIRNNDWHITEGKRSSEVLTDSDKYLSEDDVSMPIMGELHVFPAIRGAGKGVAQIIIGVILIIIVIVILIVAPPAGAGLASALLGAAASAGIGLVAGGISALMTKSPNTGDYENANPDQKLSFLFNGAINNTEQGVPVPIVCGECLTGSTVISAGMDVVQL